MDIIRTKDYGTYQKVKFSGWGTYLESIPDPNGQSVSKKTLDSIKLRSDFPIISIELTSATINLFRYLAGITKPTLSHGGNEVSVLLLRKKPDFKQWKIVVPKQLVTPASVTAETEKTIDIITGQEYNVFPPEGWSHCGSIHSHVQMRCFFSGTDNSDDEGVPGAHIVVGRIGIGSKDHFEVLSSIITKDGRRLTISSEALMELDIDSNIQFHPSVLDYITIKEAAVVKPSQGYQFPSFSVREQTVKIGESYTQLGLNFGNGYLPEDNEDYTDDLWLEAAGLEDELEDGDDEENTLENLLLLLDEFPEPIHRKVYDMALEYVQSLGY